MHIGEVSELIADITYISQHSLEVQVSVWAEDIIKGKLGLTLSHSEMHIGEVSELIGEIITYTSKHSLEVQVTVWAEDIIKGKLSIEREDIIKGKV